MNKLSKYTNIMLSKTGIEIPVYDNGKTIDSKYNPKRESENIINNITENYSFFIVLGVGSGILIKTIKEKYPNSKIIGIESSYENVIFLHKLPIIQTLLKSTDFILTDITNIEETLLSNYLPAKYGNFKIIEQIGWINENKSLIPEINTKINHSIGIISSDYSVQCHFGKIWESNIINNLKLESKFGKNKEYEIDNNKIAIIVAAGPSLDKTIKTIKENINQYFIIATDTSYQVLLKNNIIPNLVVSIDGQFISQNHFKQLNKNTLFMLDLCSNYSISQKLYENKYDVLHFVSGHPLSTYVNFILNKHFIELFSGAGTVTITALDLCIKLGFKSITILGADFSYSFGKSYCKGTYFDTLFNNNSSLLSSTEKEFNKLMFRTDLNQINNNTFSTKLLTAYKKSFEDYILLNKYSIENENNVYYINKNENQLNLQLHSFKINYKELISKLKKISMEELEVPLLPYIAWLRNQNKYKNNDYISLLKLAQSHIVSYN